MSGGLREQPRYRKQGGIVSKEEFWQARKRNMSRPPAPTREREMTDSLATAQHPHELATGSLQAHLDLGLELLVLPAIDFADLRLLDVVGVHPPNADHPAKGRELVLGVDLGIQVSPFVSPGTLNTPKVPVRTNAGSLNT